LGNDHEIEFHEIEIGIFQEIKTFFKIDQEIEKALGARGGHNLTQQCPTFFSIGPKFWSKSHGGLKMHSKNEGGQKKSFSKNYYVQ
jgi:hypothetical protein